MWPCSSRGGCQCLVLILPLETMRTFLVWTGTWDHIDVQGLCRTDPTSHWLQHPGEQAPPLTESSTQESSPAPLLDSTVEMALVEEEWVSQPKGRQSGHGDETLSTLPLAICSSQESWPLRLSSGPEN